MSGTETGASSWSAEFESQESTERAAQREDPEAQHDLGLGPAALLKMVMDRRHQEDAAAFTETAFGELEPAHLHHDGDELHDEHAADDHQRERLVDHERHHANQPAERERPGVAH